MALEEIRKNWPIHQTAGSVLTLKSAGGDWSSSSSYMKPMWRVPPKNFSEILLLPLFITVGKKSLHKRISNLKMTCGVTFLRVYLNASRNESAERIGSR